MRAKVSSFFIPSGDGNKTGKRTTTVYSVADNPAKSYFRLS